MKWVRRILSHKESFTPYLIWHDLNRTVTKLLTLLKTAYLDPPKALHVHT